MDTASLAVLRTQAEVDAAVDVHLDEIARLGDIIKSLKRHRNTLAPVSHLPDEILGQVFHRVVRTSMVSRFSMGGISYWPLPWMKITQVCRHWRRVAIAHRQLWTQIELVRSPRLVNMFVDRADGCPYDVTGAIFAQDWATFTVNFFAEHAQHIRSFTRMCLRPNPCAALANLLGDDPCLPSLEVLDLQFERDLNDAPVQVPPFTLRSLPHLQRLCCANAPMSFFDSFSTSGLTSLTITSPLVMLTVASLVNLLAGLDALESLVLLNACTADRPLADLPLPSPPVAHLPHLRSIDITDNEGHATPQILERFHFPASTQVYIYIYGGTINGMDSIMAALATAASGEASGMRMMSPFQSCSITRDRFCLWTSKVPVADLAAPSTQGWPEPLWVLRFKDVVMAYAIPPFLSHFQPHSVALRCAMPRVNDIDVYSTVRELSILERGPLEDLINAHERGAGRSRFMPSLELLVLRDVQWIKQGENPISYAEHMPPLSQRFERLLRLRNPRIGPIKQLKLVKSRKLGGWDPMRLVEKQLVGSVEVE